MKIVSAYGALAGMTILLAGCTAAPRPVVRQSLALPAGPRSIVLAPPAPDTAQAFVPGSAAVRTALEGAGYQPRPTVKDARYLLVLTTASAARRLGSLVPSEAPDAATVPPAWIVRPRGGLGGRAVLRVTATLLDASSGRELWRGAISAPRHGGKPDLDGLTTLLLAELPRG